MLFSRSIAVVALAGLSIATPPPSKGASVELYHNDGSCSIKYNGAFPECNEEASISSFTKYDEKTNECSNGKNEKEYRVIEFTDKCDGNVTFQWYGHADGKRGGSFDLDRGNEQRHVDIGFHPRKMDL